MTKRTDRFPPCRKALVAPRRDEGFTLVELLLVMFVMSVLVALVVGVGRRKGASARPSATRTG